MPSNDPPRRLRDILANIERIRRYVSGFTAEQFLSDEKTQDAVERCFERIAEAARKIGDALDTKYPEAEFHKLRQFGSILRHDYDDVDADLIWLATTERLDTLEAVCRRELAD
ncbi:MAG TPA: HepT-like ribonuclease domain-containing protein [Stellaceae bacterium]|jgi:uncharacterized protein with HEPN domain